MVKHAKTWSVHYSLLKKFLRFENKGQENNHIWDVKYDWSVEVSARD